MSLDETQRNALREKLAQLFSGYRAEWLGPAIFDLFTEPAYFPQLTTSHPCFLVGGRGTGKTTALRCLSYQGQAALRSSGDADWPFVGLYYRVNTNRVRAFGGPEVPESAWIRLFAHYMNLEFVELVLRFLEWYGARQQDAVQLSEESLHQLGASLHLRGVSSRADALRQIQSARVVFEAAINNIAAGPNPPLSLQGAPIDLLLREVKELPQFAATSFFFLVDEYENLDEPQQRVLNTLIKHCGSLYSFKVGVRELGFKQHSTLNEHELLVHPADYKLINITDELQGRFPEFAAEVCDRRLSLASQPGLPSVNLPSLLPEISAEDEARILGVRDAVKEELERIRGLPELHHLARNWLEEAHPLEVFTLFRRAEAEGKTELAKLEEATRHPEAWQRQYENFKHSYLFAIRRGKRGVRKHFAGWRVYCLLAACNIRYLLELVDQALTSHLDSGRDPLSPVGFEIQTKAAQLTGQKNLRELEGLSLSGAKLTRFLLSLGRVFQVMAEDPVGHTPEINQFCLSADVVEMDLRDRVSTLLREGIMHLALLRYPGSKLQDQTDIRQFDYSIHPIFAPFFGFSHRRKRKIELSDTEVWDLVESPSEAIRDLLRSQQRSVDDDLPEQMRLFAEFYALPHQ